MTQAADRSDVTYSAFINHRRHVQLATMSHACNLRAHTALTSVVGLFETAHVARAILLGRPAFACRGTPTSHTQEDPDGA